MNEKNFNSKIAVLRLDGDWYESTMSCLKFLFPKVVPGGMIIIDDCHIWEGCTKAVHDYLSNFERPERICQFENKTAYIIKI
ncbi:MAG: TylF/MycF/NovP-related O-methyltransferase [Ginsengibacter sp.]